MAPIQCHSMQDVQGCVAKRVPCDFRTVGGMQIDIHNTTRFAGQCSTGPSKHAATYPAFLRIGSSDSRDHEEDPPTGTSVHTRRQHFGSLTETG